MKMNASKKKYVKLQTRQDVIGYKVEGCSDALAIDLRLNE